MSLEKWQIESFQDTFKRCYGLQSILKRAETENNALMRTDAIDALARVTGFRRDFIYANLQEIIDLKMEAENG